MFNSTAKKYGKMNTCLYLCRAEISAFVVQTGLVCPFLATK